jgi:hypothetical protein
MQLEDAYAAHLRTQFEKHEPGCTWLCFLESKQELFYSAMSRRFFRPFFTLLDKFLTILSESVELGRTRQKAFLDGVSDVNKMLLHHLLAQIVEDRRLVIHDE